MKESMNIIIKPEYLGLFVCMTLGIMVIIWMLKNIYPGIAKKRLEYKYKKNPDKYSPDEDRKAYEEYLDKIDKKVDAIYEMLISNICILTAMMIHYWFNNFLKGHDFLLSCILLGMIVLASYANSLISKHCFKIKHDPKETPRVRLLSSIGMSLIFIYMKFQSSTVIYDGLIQTYFLLVAGRFVYFDMSKEGVRKELIEMMYNIDILIWVLLYTYISWKATLNLGIYLGQDNLQKLFWLSVSFLLVAKVAKGILEE